MSLISLPPKQVWYSEDNACEPTKVSLTFPGTCNCEVGHSIDSKNYAKSAERLQQAQNSCSSEQARRDKEKEDAKLAYMKKRRDEFTEKGLKLAFYGAVETKVKCAAMCTDHLLDERRNKLREMLLGEDAAYASEYIALCQQVAATREEELKRKAFDLKTKQERERKEFVQQKLLQHKVLNCDPARSRLSQQKLMEIKKDQKWQIQQKYAVQEAKREEERMYHDLMIKQMACMKESDEEQAKIRWQKQRELEKAFNEQMEWKKKKDEEEIAKKALEKQLAEEEVQKMKEQEKRELEEKIKRNAKSVEEFKEYLKKERQYRERRKEEEDAIDSGFLQLAQIELDKEKAKVQDQKSQLKKEMLAYKENCEELRHQRETEDRKIDEMLQELNMKKYKQKEEERIRLRMAREQLFNSVVRVREEQVREKMEREKKEKEAAAREIDLLNTQIFQQKKIREDYEKRCAEKRKQYARELMEQIKQNEEARKRDKEQKEEYLKAVKEEEERKIREVEEVLRLPIDPKPHPMKEIIIGASPDFDSPIPCTK